MVPMIIVMQRFRDKVIVIRREEPYLLRCNDETLIIFIGVIISP